MKAGGCRCNRLVIFDVSPAGMRNPNWFIPDFSFCFFFDWSYWCSTRRRNHCYFYFTLWKASNKKRKVSNADEEGRVWSIRTTERERGCSGMLFIFRILWVLVLLFRWMEMRRVAILPLTSEGIRRVVRPFNTFETPFWLCQLLLRLNTRFPSQAKTII